VAQIVNSPRFHPVSAIDDRFEIRAVENALADLWRQEDRATGTPDTVRASSVNFIIPIAPDGYDHWQNRLADLARLLPSRILLLEEAPAGSKPTIDAHVTATCHRRKGGTLVCSEMVHIKAVPQACLLLPSICRALAISDLPLFHLSLDHTGMDSQAVHALFELADLTVVDSELLAGPLWSDDPVYCDRDLVWPRLTPWRAAVGHFVSTCEELDPAVITHVDVAGTTAAAPLLAGWLGCLLRWQTSLETSTGSPVTTVRGVPLQLSFDDQGTARCGVAALTLSGDDSANSRLAVRVDADYFAIDARVGGTRFETRIPIHSLDFAEEVAAIVHSRGSDAVYGQSRRLALTMRPAVS